MRMLADCCRDFERTLDLYVAVMEAPGSLRVLSESQMLNMYFLNFFEVLVDLPRVCAALESAVPRLKAVHQTHPEWSDNPGAWLAVQYSKALLAFLQSRRVDAAKSFRKIVRASSSPIMPWGWRVFHRDLLYLFHRDL